MSDVGDRGPLRQLSEEDVSRIDAVYRQIYEAIGEMTVWFERLDLAVWELLKLIEVNAGAKVRKSQAKDNFDNAIDSLKRLLKAGLPTEDEYRERVRTLVPALSAANSERRRMIHSYVTYSIDALPAGALSRDLKEQGEVALRQLNVEELRTSAKECQDLWQRTVLLYMRLVSHEAYGTP